MSKRAARRQTVVDQWKKLGIQFGDESNPAKLDLLLPSGKPKTLYFPRSMPAEDIIDREIHQVATTKFISDMEAGGFTRGRENSIMLGPEVCVRLMLALGQRTFVLAVLAPDVRSHRSDKYTRELPMPSSGWPKATDYLKQLTKARDEIEFEVGIHANELSVASQLVDHVSKHGWQPTVAPNPLIVIVSKPGLSSFNCTLDCSEYFQTKVLSIALDGVVTPADIANFSSMVNSFAPKPKILPKPPEHPLRSSIELA